jgi:hypothetical protein
MTLASGEKQCAITYFFRTMTTSRTINDSEEKVELMAYLMLMEINIHPSGCINERKDKIVHPDDGG